LPKIKHFPSHQIFGPPEIFGLATLLPAGQVAKLVSGLFYCWSLSCNNNMATNLQMFTSSYDIRRFVACDS